MTVVQHYASEKDLRTKIRWAIIFTILGLFVSGLTALPLGSELEFFLRMKWLPDSIHQWFETVDTAVLDTSQKYPLMRYGYDWLGFAHWFIAIAFIGPLMDPIKNKWVIEWGMIVSALTILIAFIAEPYRQIPLIWSLTDAAIGVGAFILLFITRRWIVEMEKMKR